MVLFLTFGFTSITKRKKSRRHLNENIYYEISVVMDADKYSNILIRKQCELGIIQKYDKWDLFGKIFFVLLDLFGV